MNVDRLIEALIEVEGGYVNHPADKGGPTRWGVTEAVARDSGYTGAMADLPKSLARLVYRKRYWEAPGFDRVSQHAKAVAEELFDTGVNMGVGVAVAFLQRALNALNHRGSDWPELKIDKTIGPQTLKALELFLKLRGPAGQKVLLRALNALQGARYIELTEQRRANRAFTYGWLSKRVVL